MNIFSQIFHSINTHFARPMTPCMKALQDEISRKAIRELVPLQASLRASDASEKDAVRITQYYRDQRNAGVKQELALWRARQKITGPQSGKQQVAV